MFEVFSTPCTFFCSAFQSFGLIKKVSEDTDLKKEKYPKLKNYECAFWTWQNNDWICISQYIVNNKGELIREQLTNYHPPNNF